ncbi:hypothetical protein PLICRDRAFT_44370 [Plicaturopsis crispa FD-325 SS-3]|nr:hypothetical protein PLICRDRAFT_44370 [Plicaturopsis crispa FD-325 SS-3]
MNATSDTKVATDDRKGSTDDRQVRDAPAPFDNPKADVILRSSDNVDFRAFKIMLSVTSSVFEGMFALPTPPQGSTGDTLKDGLPVIPLSEDSELVKKLLLYSLPSAIVERPPLETLRDVLAVLDAATKYDMQDVHRHARTALVSTRLLSSDTPLRIFVTAMRYKFEDEARAAAKYNLAVPVSDWPYIDELDDISTRQYHRLQDYHRRCGEVASTACPTLITKWRSDFEWEKCSPPLIWSSYGSVAMWLWEAIGEAAAALKAKPRGATVAEILTSERFVALASKCTHCGDKAQSKTKRFAALCANAIEEAISTVEVDLVDLRTRQ